MSEKPNDIKSEKEIENIVNSAKLESSDETKKDDSAQFSYSRTNGETIVDPFAVESFKNEQNRDIIENGRLGSYDEYGNYLFIPEIRQELIEIPKLIYNTAIKDGKTTYDLRAIIPIFGDMYFKLRINKYEAKLLLIENVTREAGQYVEVYEELVDSIALSETEPVSTDVIFTLFHIYEDDDDYGMEFDAYYGFENILLKKIYMGLLSNEIRDLTASDEHDCYLEMMQIIEESGEYGERIKKEFLTRLRDRRQIFDIKDEYAYDRAVNEILLSSVDIATTEEDKENPKTRAVYNKIINVRNKNLAKYIEQAEERVDENYVKNVEERTIKSFIQKNYEMAKEVKLEYLDKLTFVSKKEKEKIARSEIKREKHKLDKPLMKQLMAQKKKEEEKKLLTKDEKIAQIVEKKKEEKKEVKKVTPAKAQKAKAKAKSKSKAKSKKGAKKKGGAKVKAKSKVKKADPKKAKKAGGKLKKDAKKKDNKKDQKKTKKKTLVFSVEKLALFEKNYRAKLLAKEIQDIKERPLKQEILTPKNTPEKQVEKESETDLKQKIEPSFGEVFEVVELEKDKPEKQEKVKQENISPIEEGDNIENSQVYIEDVKKEPIVDNKKGSLSAKEIDSAFVSSFIRESQKSKNTKIKVEKQKTAEKVEQEKVETSQNVQKFAQEIRQNMGREMEH